MGRFFFVSVWQCRDVLLFLLCQNQKNMKYLRVAIMVLCLISFLVSCTQEVDVYAPYEEVPIIYGLLDANADTNYIKITRAFYALGDASQVAMNPDSSNYPGRLDARLTEYCNGEMTRVIVLDTITIYNKQEGVFYAPAQKLYYTAENLCKNTSNSLYSYRLDVVFPHDTISTRCDIVGNSGFKEQSLAFNFSKQYFGTHRPFKFYPAINAKIYQVQMAFTFMEQRSPDSDSIPRTMIWDICTHEDSYFSSNMDEDCYVFTYRPESFYEVLGNFIGGDTSIVGLSRFISDYPVELIITAGGDKLRKYVYYNDPANLITPGDNEFTLIDGGYGVFSSRMTRRSRLRLAGETVPDLLEMTNWGFKFMGGEKDWSIEP